MAQANWIPKGETGPCVYCGTIFKAEKRARLCCSVLCVRRYARTQRSYVRVPLEERFWKHVDVGDPTQCWEWRGFRDHHGYGRLQSPGKTGPVLKAHRVSYELHHGVQLGDVHILHSCDNPPCVNPAHLRTGTPADNAQDAVDRKRVHVVYSDDAVREIYAATHSGHTIAEVARWYGVSESQVSNIHHRRQRVSALEDVA